MVNRIYLEKNLNPTLLQPSGSILSLDVTMARNDDSIAALFGLNFRCGFLTISFALTANPAISVGISLLGL